MTVEGGAGGSEIDGDVVVGAWGDDGGLLSFDLL